MCLLPTLDIFIFHNLFLYCFVIFFALVVSSIHLSNVYLSSVRPSIQIVLKFQKKPTWPVAASRGAHSQNGAGGGVLGDKDFVLHPVDVVVVVLPAVRVAGLRQGNQLDGLTLLQDAAGGGEATEVFADGFAGGVADLLVWKTVEGVDQQTLVHEEGISRHLLKLPVGEVGLTVRDEVGHVVLPCDSELDEVQQVLVSVTISAGFIPMTMT